MRKNKTIFYFFLVVIFAAIMRILPHPPNIIPITALSLFSGATVKGKARFTLPLSAMILSDIFLGFHSTIPYVYGSFIFITFVGRFLKKKRGVARLLSVSLVSSIVFFLITNFGVWVTTAFYTKDLNGLLNAYSLGLPFFRNSIIGDIFYTFSLFYGYEFFLILSSKLSFLKR